MHELTFGHVVAVFAGLLVCCWLAVLWMLRRDDRRMRERAKEIQLPALTLVQHKRQVFGKERT